MGVQAVTLIQTMPPLSDKVLRSFAESKKASVSAVSAVTSAMICLVPDAACADSLRLPNGEPATDMHLTLLYYKSGLSAMPSDTLRILKIFASQQQPLAGLVNGLARFSSDEPEGDPLVALPDVVGLFELRAALVDVYAPDGWADNHGFTPHITIAYLPLGIAGPARVKPRPVTFDALWVWANGERTRFGFGEY